MAECFELFRIQGHHRNGVSPSETGLWIRDPDTLEVDESAEDRLNDILSPYDLTSWTFLLRLGRSFQALPHVPWAILVFGHIHPSVDHCHRICGDRPLLRFGSLEDPRPGSIPEEVGFLLVGSKHDLSEAIERTGSPILRDAWNVLEDAPEQTHWIVVPSESAVLDSLDDAGKDDDESDDDELEDEDDLNVDELVDNSNDAADSSEKDADNSVEYGKSLDRELDERLAREADSDARPVVHPDVNHRRRRTRKSERKAQQEQPTVLPQPAPAQNPAIVVLRWLLFIPVGFTAVWLTRALFVIALNWAFDGVEKAWEVGFTVIFVLGPIAPFLFIFSGMAGMAGGRISPRTQIGVPIFCTLLVLDALIAFVNVVSYSESRIGIKVASIILASLASLIGCISTYKADADHGDLAHAQKG